MPGKRGKRFMGRPGRGWFISGLVRRCRLQDASAGFLGAGMRRVAAKLLGVTLVLGISTPAFCAEIKSVPGRPGAIVCWGDHVPVCDAQAKIMRSGLRAA